jgi:hypothetical protein
LEDQAVAVAVYLLVRQELLGGQALLVRGTLEEKVLATAALMLMTALEGVVVLTRVVLQGIQELHREREGTA